MIQAIFDACQTVAIHLIAWAVVWIIFLGAAMTIGRWLAGDTFNYRRWMWWISFGCTLAIVSTVAFVLMPASWTTSVWAMFIPCLKGGFALHAMFHAFVRYVDAFHQRQVSWFQRWVTLICIYGLSLLSLLLVVYMRVDWLAHGVMAVSEHLVKSALMACVIFDVFMRNISGNEPSGNIPIKVLEEIFMD